MFYAAKVTHSHKGSKTKNKSLRNLLVSLQKISAFRH